MDYVTVLDKDSTPGPVLPLAGVEIEHFRTVAELLSGVFSTAAHHTGADLVSASVYGPGHGVGSSQPLTLGFERREGDGVFFHSTREGMRAVAAKVLAILRPPES